MIILLFVMFVLGGVGCKKETAVVSEDTEIMTERETEENLQAAETFTEEKNDSTEYSIDEMPVEKATDVEEEKEMRMTVTVNGTDFLAVLEQNQEAEELVQMMKKEDVVLSLSDYSGFEKVGPLGRSLTTSNRQTTTKSGDIVLYNGSQIVIFYGSNSWSYTRLGKIEDLTGWEDALGNGDVTVTFSLKNKGMSDAHE